MEEVEMLCHRIVIMDKGRIIASGSNDELKNSIELSERISIVIEDIDKEIINCFHQLEGEVLKRHHLM